MTTKCFIYALVDPRTDAIRYVGKTTNPSWRFRQHLRYDRTDSHKSRWLALLSKLGLTPKWVVLEEVKLSEWQEKERFWIANLKKDGCSLTNETPGGDGRQKGFKHKPASVRKIVEALKRRSPEIRRQAALKTSLKLKGRPLLEDHRKKLSVSHIAFWQTLSDKQKRAYIKHLRRTWTSEERIKLSRTNTGRKNNQKSTSNFSGVSWFKRDGCWRAWTRRDGKQWHLGYFRKEKDAALAYNRAVKKIHGKFARLNKL